MRKLLAKSILVSKGGPSYFCLKFKFQKYFKFYFQIKNPAKNLKNFTKIFYFLIKNILKLQKYSNSPETTELSSKQIKYFKSKLKNIFPLKQTISITYDE